MSWGEELGKRPVEKGKKKKEGRYAHYLLFLFVAWEREKNLKGSVPAERGEEKEKRDKQKNGG